MRPRVAIHVKKMARKTQGGGDSSYLFLHSISSRKYSRTCEPRTWKILPGIVEEQLHCLGVLCAIDTGNY